MAAPSVPTADDLVIEALRKAGTPNDYRRAKDNWLEEIKNDVWHLAKKLTSLQAVNVSVTTNGLSTYSAPTDFSSYICMSIMDGNDSGTAQAGGATSITLASGETASDVVGKEILIYGGTGSSQARQVTAYNATTKVATTSPAWTTNPDSTSTYLIVTDYYDLKQLPVWAYGERQQATETGRPEYYYPIGDADNSEYLLYPAPLRTSDTTLPYGIKLRYYADLMEVDLTGTLLSTLYQRWRNIFIQGLFYKALQDNNDPQAPMEGQKYNAMLQTLIMRESYGMDLQNLQVTIGE